VKNTQVVILDKWLVDENLLPKPLCMLYKAIFKLFLMKTIEDILKLGDPRLYEKCVLVLESELAQVKGWVSGLL